MHRKLIVIVVGFVILTGCGHVTGNQDFKQEINHVEQYLLDEDWETLSVQAEHLQRVYKKHQWKVQLIGDEGEYERLHESINRLRAAVDAKEAKDARIELATIKSILEDIYSL